MLLAADVLGFDLPVRAALPAVIRALRATGTALLVAPPGSGKTSLLPLALADAEPGRILVAEPRRIATRAAARRMAQLLGEQTGGRIGYAMRGDRRVSAATRVEVVTTGLLVQRLQRDPDLPGVSAVVIDECHERHLDSDLALAFCLDVRANLRPELQVVATSATPDSARIAAALGHRDAPAPVISASAQVHPVEVVWAPPPRSLPLLPGYRVDPRMLDHVAEVIRTALVDRRGDALVFLPGEAEIHGVAARLTGRLGSTAVLELFGRQRADEQDRVLRPGDARRVVLSTAVAESSLTVPGVRIVVDAGLSREPRTDHSRGLGTLITTRVSRSAADQRAGRAGREGPGTVYRCWPAAEQERLVDHPAPEIATTDLTGFALAVALWGRPRGAGLRLLDPAPPAALDVAVATLHDLRAVDGAGRITARGRAMAQIGAPPRLSRALLDGAVLVGNRRAREVVAVLSEDAAPRGVDDLVALWRRLRSGSDPAAARWRDEVRRLDRAVPSAGAPEGGESVSDDVAAGLVAGLAFPERVARLRPGSERNFLMAGGTGAQLPAGSPLTGSAWLAVAVADRGAGRADAAIRLAAPIDEVTAREVAAGLLTRVDQIAWENGELLLRQTDSLGAIELAVRPLRSPDPTRVLAAVRDGLRSEGLGVLHWTGDAEQLRARMALCRRVFGDPWPEVGDAALLADPDGWLGPELPAVRRRSDLTRIQAGPALRRLLPWPAAARFDELVPERLEVPSGSRVRVRYEFDGPPVLAVKVQETFGWTGTPTVADGRVPVVLHLLSPAGRPVAVTGDLESFWRQGYPQVRSELRGRYPRHPWPEDPMAAPPTRRLRPRG